jgi:class 3 adenylate cyclase
MEPSFHEGPIQAPSADEIELMLPKHAPPGWQERYNAYGRLADLISEGTQFLLLTLAADIRNSTLLQEEAINFGAHAMFLTRFVQAAIDTVRNIGGGWFDKFTGDGFLAYWLLARTQGERWVRPLAAEDDDDPRSWEQLQSALNSVLILHWFFERRVINDFRLNSQNMPEGTGLAIGLDAGPAYFAVVGDDVTILGKPVVGAFRMVSAAGADETVANTQLGQRLQRRHQREPLFGIQEIRRETRVTKEYPGGQEVFRFVHDHDSLLRVEELLRGAPMVTD